MEYCSFSTWTQLERFTCSFAVWSRENHFDQPDGAMPYIIVYIYLRVCLCLFVCVCVWVCVGVCVRTCIHSFLFWLVQCTTICALSVMEPVQVITCDTLCMSTIHVHVGYLSILDTFPLRFPQTIGAAFGAKKVSIDGESVTLGIWVRIASSRYNCHYYLYVYQWFMTTLLLLVNNILRLITYHLHVHAIHWSFHDSYGLLLWLFRSLSIPPSLPSSSLPSLPPSRSILASLPSTPSLPAFSFISFFPPIPRTLRGLKDMSP